MIKLPKEVVLGLEAELTELLAQKEAVVTEEQITTVKEHNQKVENLILEKQEAIKNLEEEIRLAKENILPIPTNAEVDETRIKGLIDMLVLSGYFVKVTKPDGEYLEKTGVYDEVAAPEEVVTEEDVLEETVVEETITEEEKVEEELPILEPEVVEEV